MAELTPEELKREQERLRLIQEQNEAAKELLSTYEKQKKVTGALTDDEKGIVNLTRDLNDLSTELANSTQKRLSGTSSLKDLEGQLKKLKEENVNFEDNAVKLSQAKLQAQQKAQELDNDRINKANQLYELENNYEAQLTRQFQKESELATLSGSRNQADRDRARELATEISQGKVQLKETQKYITAKERQVELAKTAADEQYNLVKQINKTIEANEKTKEQLTEELVLLQQAVQVKKKEEVYDVLKEKFNTKQITDLLTISGITKAIVDGMFQFDKTSVAISKNIGYGAYNANMMAGKMQAISVFSLASNLTMKNMTEAMGQLNEATGFVADYSKDALETQIMLTKQFGLTGEEASGIYKLSVLTGKSSEKVNDEMVGAFIAARNASGAGIPFKESIAAAAKVSGQLKANLQANPAGIVKAVVTVKALGTSLEQTAAQGEKLLEFGSSLESELKAELLTGKQLNLEKARAAALAGDQVTLAEELNKNIGTYDDFSKMNVLQQKALAESVGLTANELANQLEKQKLAQAAGKSLAEFTKDEALEAQKRKEIQQSFNDLVEKLQNLLGTIGALFAPLLSFITNILDQSGLVYIALGGWLIYTKLLGKDFKSLGGSIKDIAKSLGNKVFGKGTSSVGDSITSSRGLTLTKKAAGGGVGAAEKTAGAADKVKGDNAAGFKDKMKNIAAGIKAFGDGKVILGGLVGLPAAAVGLIAMIPGTLGAKLIEQINGEKLKESLKGLANGIEAMGTGKVLLGSLALILASIGLIAMIPGLLGAKLIEQINGEKFQEAMYGLAYGIEAMGNNKVLKGALGLVAASVGLLLLTPAMPALLLLQLVKGNLIKSALTGLGIGLAALGESLSKGNVILGIAVLTVSMIGLGYALKLAAPGIEAFGKAIKSTFEGIGAIITAAAGGIATIFTSLQNVDVMKLLAIGPALIGIGVGLASLGAGGVIGAIGAFLGGDPIEKLQGLAASGDGLTKTATALQAIAGALVGVSVALAAIDVSKLEALNEFSSNQATNAAVKGITDFITTPIKAIGEAIGGEKEEIKPGIDLTPMISAINEVKASVDRLYGKDQSINMDGKKVGTTLVQGSYKVA
jgi:hypothetical protein